MRQLELKIRKPFGMGMTSNRKKLLFCMLYLSLSASSCYIPNQLPGDSVLRYEIKGDQAYLSENYDEAEKHYKAAIRAAEKSGPKSCIVLIPMRSLAKVYSAQNRYAEAEEILRRRQYIVENVCAPDQDELWRVYDDLAIFYFYNRKPAEAKPYCQRVLAIKAKAFGETSNELLFSLELYAPLLRDNKEYTEADLLEKQAGSIRNSK